MAHIEAVIFDLDNVLYDEKTYIDAAFRRIARFLADHSCFCENEIFRKLSDDWRRKGSLYPRLFNDALADLGLNQALLGDILNLYATVDAPIALYPGLTVCSRV